MGSALLQTAEPFGRGVVSRRGHAAVPSDATENAPTQRDGHLQHVEPRGSQVIGDGLRSREDERRATEVAVAAHALNRMLEFGRPSYVRTA